MDAIATERVSDDDLRAELKRAQADAEHYRTLVESVSDALVVVDFGGRIVQVNRQAESLFGYPRAELLGEPVEMLIPARLRESHQAHRDAFLTAPACRVMGSGMDLMAQRKDGSEVPVEVRLSPFKVADGLLIATSVRDISDRRTAEAAVRAAHDELEQRVRERTAALEQANGGLVGEIAERRLVEQELRVSKAKLRLIADSMPAGMAYVDARRTFLYHNQRFADWLGLSAEDIDGHRVREVMGDEVYKEIRDKISLALAGQSVRFDQEYKRADGTVVCWSVRYSPQFAADGTVIGYIAMMTDVTEQRETEQALHQAQKMDAVGQLTGGVAHDFNNLLTVVLGNLQILAHHTREDLFAAELIQAATNAARRGAELNRTLLAFSRRQRLEPMPIDLSAMILRLVSMLRRTLGEQIQIIVDARENLPRATADPGQLEAALLNLAVNARDAMAQGGKLTIETAAVTLDENYAAREADVTPGAYVMLAVSDTGCGMTPEVQARAFEPFFTTKGVGKGSGLGLARVYGFVKQSGGHLKIYSELGRGTTIKLYLPTIKYPFADSATAPVQAPPQAVDSETVLVVEDEEDVRALACRLLGWLGYRVLQAADAASALDLLEREPDIDLLLTDVVLPGGIDGPELARRARESVGPIKVLYTSGYTGNAVQQLDAVAGEVRLLSKPYRIEDLAHKVRSAIDGTPDQDVPAE